MQEARLDELKMSPSALRQFTNSDAAQGIRAGFEAELIFPGMGDSEGGDSEPDYDADERAYSIDDIINFFEYDDYGYGLSDRQADRLRQSLENEYFEYFDDALMSEWDSDKFNQVRDYIERNDLFDQEEFIEDYLRDELGLSEEQIAEIVSTAKEATSSRNTPPEYRQASDAAAEQLDALTEQSIDTEDDTYDRALDEFRDEFGGGSEEDWLRENYRYMSDVAEAHDLTWPYIRYENSEGGYNEYSADSLADELKDVTGMRVIASSGYHSTSRSDNRWIIEPDSSLEGDDSDDMPCEIVSPPMPLKQCLEMMDKFFSWAKGYGAYANSSTGFHMGVSLPITGGKTDFVKLALFLGDEHVLKEFGRSSNTYTEAAMKKIRNRLKNNPSDIGEAMKLMQHGLIELANRAFKIEGFGKYTSINPKGNYIEFRSAGGDDYFQDIKKLQNTLMRYARAMTVAANPAAERQEYYKKLYKLISPSQGDAAMDLFARFASGTISKEELKNKWAEATLAKDAPETQETSTWAVYDTQTKQYVPGMKYSGYTESEAYALARQVMSPGSTMIGFRKMFDEKYELRNVSKSTGKWAIIDRDTGETLEVVDSENRGDAADLAMEKYAGKGIDYYIEPVQSNEPKRKLSRRAELAQRIKGQKADEFRGLEYVILDRMTGSITDPFRATSLEQAVEKADRYAARPGSGVEDFLQRYTLAQKTPDGNRPISTLEFTRARGAGSYEQQNSTDYKYYIKDIISGNIVHLFNADSTEEAAAYNRQYAERAGRRDQYKYGITQALQPEQLEQGRAAMQSAPDRVGTTAQTTLEPGQQWVIYSIATGTSVKSLSHTDRSAAAEEARTWIRMNNGDVTKFAIRAEHNPNAPQTQSEPIPGSTLDLQRQRAQASQSNIERQPSQVTTDAGIPMWEIYDRRAGSALTRYPDHNQTAAWSTAQQWLRDAHVPEDRWSEYSVRPLTQEQGNT